MKSKVLISILVLSVLLPVRGVFATSKIEMEQRYEQYKSQRTAESLPFTLESTEKGNILGASVTSFLPFISFEKFTSRLSMVSEWCEFIPLHLNVKACMYQIVDGEQKLGFYIGVKGYKTPDDAEVLLLDFNAEVEDEVFLAHLTAKYGPYGSSNYDFHFRAIEQDGGIYLEFDLSSQPGVVANLAKLYLATVGRSKIGFSITGKTWRGDPDYVGGQRGGAERNIVRYLLSIRTYFETLGMDSGEDQYRKRLETWFDHTDKYRKQLYEMSKSDYVAIKLRERKNQFILMDSIVNNTVPVYEPDRHSP